MLASVRSATLLGIDGQLVEVEVHISNGLPSYTVVGLPDAAVRESRERVRAALLSSGLMFPMRRITVNLAPAGVRKSGAGLELAVAAGLMMVDGDLPAGCLDGLGLVGELGLDGSVRRVPGALALVRHPRRAGVEAVVVPTATPRSLSRRGVSARPDPNAAELRCCLKGEMPWPARRSPARAAGRLARRGDGRPRRRPGPGRGRARGRSRRRWGHHLRLAGPPGAGRRCCPEDPSIRRPRTAEAME